MIQIKAITNFLSLKAVAVGLCLCAALASQACSYKLETQFKSHKVTIDKQSFTITNQVGIEDNGDVAVFKYDGFSNTGNRVRVVISNEEVSFNGDHYGTLKPGDAMTITCNGVSVNSMSYEDTEKYLRDNSKQAAARLVEN